MAQIWERIFKAEKETIEAGAFTIPNPKHPDRKDRNQDASFEDVAHRFFGVFDGVGGDRPAGDVAAGTARDFIAGRADFLEEDNMTPEEVGAEIVQVFKDANKHILGETDRNPALKRMATTAALLKIVDTQDGKKGVIGHVGDSRAYHWTAGGELKQITLDDGPLREHFHGEEEARRAQVRLAGDPRTFNRSDLALFGNRNRITQVLGSLAIEPHIEIVDLAPGDYVLLLTDAIFDNLTDVEIEYICRNSETPEQMARNLAEAVELRMQEKLQGKASAGMRAKLDDITALAVKVGE
ncbi:MAG: protein phosphatase 2C domain-containing protein [Patescibacteria group bacterium]